MSEEEGREWFICPKLGQLVELTLERARHIVRRHPELGPDARDLIARALADPDHVRRSRRSPGARLFSRLHEHHYVVVIVEREAARARSWIVTAYLARRLTGGEIEWQRD